MVFQDWNDEWPWNPRIFNGLSQVRSAALFLGPAVVCKYVCVASCWTLGGRLLAHQTQHFFPPIIGIIVWTFACYCHQGV